MYVYVRMCVYDVKWYVHINISLTESWYNRLNDNTKIYMYMYHTCSFTLHLKFARAQH